MSLRDARAKTNSAQRQLPFEHTTPDGGPTAGDIVLSTNKPQDRWCTARTATAAKAARVRPTQVDRTHSATTARAESTPSRRWEAMHPLNPNTRQAAQSTRRESSQAEARPTAVHQLSVSARRTCPVRALDCHRCGPLQFRSAADRQICPPAARGSERFVRAAPLRNR